MKALWMQLKAIRALVVARAYKIYHIILVQYY